MPRDIAIIGRQDADAHRRFITGMTESPPRLEELDERQPPAEVWVVDVFIGIPGDDEAEEDDILFSVPLAQYARQNVTDEGIPVLLERNNQGKLTVIGRAMTVPSGFAFGDVFEDNLTIRRVNYSQLRLGWLPDLDWTLESLQGDPGTELQADPTEPFQQLRAFDAFGHQVYGPEVTNPPVEIQELLQPVPLVETKSRHRTIKAAKLGPKGDSDAMLWGTTELQPTIVKSITAVI